MRWLRCYSAVSAFNFERGNVFFGLTNEQLNNIDPQVRIFLSLAHGFHNSVPIVRANAADKEYHFQNWVRRRIESAGLGIELQGRHSYPDFILSNHASGYEVKGLSYPGRVNDFDCNSQLPLSTHEGRVIYYIFGRYPVSAEQEFPVLDLVLCSASFLNAETENTNTNQSFRGAGSYGDILIRDRRMYVCTTPYAIAPFTNSRATLILENGSYSESDLPKVLVKVDEITRVESAEVVVGYNFDLRINTLSSEKELNPNAGRRRSFSAYQIGQL